MDPTRLELIRQKMKVTPGYYPLEGGEQVRPGDLLAFANSSATSLIHRVSFDQLKKSYAAANLWGGGHEISSRDALRIVRPFSVDKDGDPIIPAILIVEE